MQNSARDFCFALKDFFYFVFAYYSQYFCSKTAVYAFLFSIAIKQEIELEFWDDENKKYSFRQHKMKMNRKKIKKVNVKDNV